MLAALDVAADERGDREVLLGELGRAGGSGWWRSIIGPLSQVGEQAARAGGRDHVPGGGLLEVVGDDRLELGHAGELALDDVAAASPVGGVVDEPHDAEDALAVDDALAGADGVAGELDALVGLPARRAR